MQVVRTKSPSIPLLSRTRLGGSDAATKGISAALGR
jgi:hypothetical protein